MHKLCICVCLCELMCSGIYVHVCTCNYCITLYETLHGGLCHSSWSGLWAYNCIGICHRRNFIILHVHMGIWSMGLHFDLSSFTCYCVFTLASAGVKMSGLNWMLYWRTIFPQSATLRHYKRRWQSMYLSKHVCRISRPLCHPPPHTPLHHSYSSLMEKSGLREQVSFPEHPVWE